MITLETLQQRPLSYSSLKEFAKSPAHYIAYLNGDKEPSKEMIFGSMLHCLLLQPKEFNSQFAVMPNVDRRTSEGKATYAKFMSEAEGKSVVQESELEDANRLVEKVMMQDHFKKLVSDCNIFENEFRQDIDGLPFRGFIDGEADNYVLEVKTASDAHPKTIINNFYDRGYHIQAAIYNMVTNKPVKYLIIETKSPYNIVVADASQDYINLGKKTVSELVMLFNGCMQNNLWDMGYEFHSGGDFEVSLPYWVK